MTTDLDGEKRTYSVMALLTHASDEGHWRAEVCVSRSDPCFGLFCSGETFDEARDALAALAFEDLRARGAGERPFRLHLFTMRKTVYESAPLTHPR